MKVHKYKLFQLIKHNSQYKIYKLQYNNQIILKLINCPQIDWIKLYNQTKQFKIIIKLKIWKHLKSQVEMSSHNQAQAATQNTITSQL